MQTPAPLLQRLQALTGMEGGRRLVLLLTQLGDFVTSDFPMSMAAAPIRRPGEPNKTFS
jgi:hypothetical protein